MTGGMSPAADVAPRPNTGPTSQLVSSAKPPSPLHVHPFLYGHSMSEDGKAKLGIRTFGARHLIGRELLIEPSVIPWAANFETMLAFLRVATAEKGYLIPDVLPD